MNPTPITDDERDTLKAAADMLADSETVAKAWADAMADKTGATLGALPTFITYCKLTNVGPKNDNNGARSRADALKKRIEWEILHWARTMILQAANDATVNAAFVAKGGTVITLTPPNPADVEDPEDTDPNPSDARALGVNARF